MKGSKEDQERRLQQAVTDELAKFKEQVANGKITKEEALARSAVFQDGMWSAIRAVYNAHHARPELTWTSPDKFAKELTELIDDE